MIDRVIHTINEKTEDGDLRRVDEVSYYFDNDVSEEAKEAVRNHVPRLKDKSAIRRVINSVE